MNDISIKINNQEEQHTPFNNHRNHIKIHKFITFEIIKMSFWMLFVFFVKKSHLLYAFFSNYKNNSLI